MNINGLLLLLDFMCSAMQTAGLWVHFSISFTLL